MERVQTARVFAQRLQSTSAVTATAPTPSPAFEVPSRFHEKTSWWPNIFGASPAPRLAVAFSILLLLIGGVALLFGWLRLREQTRQLAAQQAALEQRQRKLDKQAADLQSQLDQLASRTPTPAPSETPPKPSEEPSSPGPSIFAIALAPGTTRSSGGGNKTFSIPAATRSVEITLSLRDTSYPSYQATILTVDRKPVFRSSTLRMRHGASGDVLTFSVPAKHLPPGDYLISVNGRTSAGSAESVDDYVLRIVR